LIIKNMFDDAGQKKIEIPTGIKPVTDESRIFSMPEKFRGLAAKVSPPVMKAAALPPPLVPVKPLSPPLPSAPLGKGEGLGVRGGLRGKNKKLSKTSWALIIAGAVLLVVLIGSGIYVYFVFKPVIVPVNNKNNVSVNVNKPANQNTANTNSSVNTNQSTNQQTNTPVSPFPNNSQSGRDTDSDGLTDAEEILYKTSSKKPDTDSDGFLDGNEVFHGYDPNAPQPARLSETSFIKTYKKAGIYETLYPEAWTVREGADESVLFVVPSGETISVGFESKDSGTTLADWFSGANPSSEVKIAEGKTKKGYAMLVAEDQMTVYVEAGNRVIIMSYQNTVKATVDYLATFEMMINSLSLVQ